MNKKTMLLLLVGLFVITSVFATQTRMSGLGHPYGLIEDDTDVFTFPATIFKYSGVAVGELQKDFDNTTWSMSANIPILEYKLGVYLNRNTMIDLPGWGVDLDVSKSVEFNFGFMDKFALGFGTSADYRPEEEYSWVVGQDTLTFNNEPTANYYSFFGGYSADGMDFGFKVEMAKAEDVDNGGDFLEISNTVFEINGRQIINPADNLELIVKAGYKMSMSEYNYKNYVTDRKIKDIEMSGSALDLGFGLQVKTSEKNKIIFGVTPIIYNPYTKETTQYFYNAVTETTTSYKTERNENAIFFPEYNLAVESQICSWLTGRFGANQVYKHITEEMDYSDIEELSGQEDYEHSSYEKNYHMNLGLTFSFGKFCVDTVLQQDLLFDGLNFLGGKDNGLATEISVKYKF
ncbi:hypothetical protein JEZ13_07255 [bacterium]|nr:hypothetical protein [bacterium]